jgi:hypothetical protein
MAIAQIMLDLLMISLLGVGVYYALRLEKQLRLLRASNTEMAQYTAEFGRTVDRAEAGIKSLKLAARESGDDLEKLIERAKALQDELQFVVDHADSLATKITNMGATLTAPPAASPTAVAAPVRSLTALPTQREADGNPEPRTRAERELLAALTSLQERQA